MGLVEVIVVVEVAPRSAHYSVVNNICYTGTTAVPAAKPIIIYRHRSHALKTRRLLEVTMDLLRWFFYPRLRIQHPRTIRRVQRDY